MVEKQGKIIKKLRIEQGMTQRDLAIKLHKAESTIGMWEQGRRELDYESLNDLANLFNVSVDYLLGRTPLKDNTVDPGIDDFAYALYGETKDLNDEQKQDIFDMVKKMTDIMKK